MTIFKMWFNKMIRWLSSSYFIIVILPGSPSLPKEIRNKRSEEKTSFLNSLVFYSNHQICWKIVWSLWVYLAFMDFVFLSYNCSWTSVMERCCPVVEEDGVYSVTDDIFHRCLNTISGSTYASYNVTRTLLPLKGGGPCPLSSALELDKIYGYFNQWQKWYHKVWGSVLSGCWNSRLGTLSYHLRSLTTLKLTSCEEAQAIWRGPSEVPANS